MHKLYTYATQLQGQLKQLIPECLPEGRWYRKSKLTNNNITIQHPHTSKHPYVKRKLMRTPIETFWKLIAWHETTHTNIVMPVRDYDDRAKDIWEAITKSKEESGDSSLCWAADPTLLDIITDECKCSMELFSNFMNTYHRFRERRTLAALW